MRKPPGFFITSGAEHLGPKDCDARPSERGDETRGPGPSNRPPTVFRKKQAPLRFPLHVGGEDQA